jgi:hypothetical protein
MPTAEREGGPPKKAFGAAGDDPGGPPKKAFGAAGDDPGGPPKKTFGAAGDDPGGPPKKATPGAVPPILPRPPELVQKQQAVAQQMAFSGAPFPGYDSETSGPPSDEDGIFIGLELPDPRTLTNPGRRD